MKIGSLFAGIGGFDLAAQWVRWETAWFSEIEPYASRVLAKHWPGIPNHGDITLMKGRDLEPVRLLCGGFPCQDISLAGKGAGIEGSRSGLWSHFARLIDECRPRWVVAENVPALRSRGLDRVLKDLAALGYDAEWHCIPAAAVGAPHRRDRIWIVAHPQELQLRQVAPAGTHDARYPGPWSLFGQAAILAHDPRIGRGTGRRDGWWSVEPDVGRVAHGVPSRLDRLRCCGNAIVPQVAYLIFQAIQAAEEEGVKRAA